MLTNVTFVGRAPNRQEIKQGLNIQHICKLLNARNKINDHQRNKHIETGEEVKYCQLNKHPKKGTIKKSY